MSFMAFTERNLLFLGENDLIFRFNEWKKNIGDSKQLVQSLILKTHCDYEQGFVKCDIILSEKSKIIT